MVNMFSICYLYLNEIRVSKNVDNLMLCIPFGMHTFISFVIVVDTSIMYNNNNIYIIL